MTDEPKLIALHIERQPGQLHHCDGETLLASCPVAFPPGKPLALVLLLADGELPLSGRCIGSKKRDDGSFDVRVRLTNLRREARLRMEQALS